jgi:hypothetical protein
MLTKGKELKQLKPTLNYSIKTVVYLQCNIIKMDFCEWDVGYGLD